MTPIGIPGAVETKCNLRGSVLFVVTFHHDFSHAKRDEYSAGESQDKRKRPSFGQLASKMAVTRQNEIPVVEFGRTETTISRKLKWS
jgi:hypothetical protein